MLGWPWHPLDLWRQQFAGAACGPRTDEWPMHSTPCSGRIWLLVLGCYGYHWQQGTLDKGPGCLLWKWCGRRKSTHIHVPIHTWGRAQRHGTWPGSYPDVQTSSISRRKRWLFWWGVGIGAVVETKHSSFLF